MNKVSRAVRRKAPVTLLLGCWLAILLISLNRLHPFWPLLESCSTGIAGILGWCAFVGTIFVLGKGHLREIAALSLVFFLLGTILGSYLEPPADPLEHLRRIHEEVAGKTVHDVRKTNRGLWHYSMASLVIRHPTTPVVPEEMLLRIRMASGLFWALGVAILYLLGMAAGLPPRWAFLSVVICFLFLGTDRFSYFRYYSLAPSFTSLMLYWLWTALFFFKTRFREMALGIASALLLVPILWVNHRQEAVFLVFLVAVWVVVNGFSRAWHGLAKRGISKAVPRQWAGVRFFLPLLLLAILYLPPQWSGFCRWMQAFFIRGLPMDYYQKSWFVWHGFYLGGHMNGYLRVWNTLEGMGMLMAILGPFYLFFADSDKSPQRKWRVYILAVLPFFGYLTPLLHCIWSSNVLIGEYYRLCYISMFWLFFADFFRQGEPVAQRMVNGIVAKRKKMANREK